MIEVDASRNHPLGMSAKVFLRDYWQKKPLLIRNAFPGFVSPIEPEDLAGLACEEMRAVAASSRTTAQRDALDAAQRPVRGGRIPRHARPRLDLAGAGRRQVGCGRARSCGHFDFLPRWRIDDVMVSFAAPGGSVGAHVDQYDVFLLQAQGQRRWQIDAGSTEARRWISATTSNSSCCGEFNPTHDWVLQPGDMLYLPPGVPHHGVAVDACLTFSIGMRAPSSAELLGDFVDTLVADADESCATTTRTWPRRRIRTRSMPPRWRARSRPECAAHERPGPAGRLVRPLHHHLPRGGEVAARRRSALAHRDRMGPGTRRRAAAPSVLAPGLAHEPDAARCCSAAAWNSRCRSGMRSAWPRPRRSMARPTPRLSEAGRDVAMDLHAQRPLPIAAGRGRADEPRAASVSKPSNTRPAWPSCARCAKPCSCSEQQVPLEEEWDALDPLCRHVIARDDARSSRSVPAG